MNDFIAKSGSFSFEIGILNSHLRQLIGSEDINITKFTNVWLKFAIILKIDEYFSPFLSLAIITGKMKFFLSIADGLHVRYPETKNVFKHFLHSDANCGNFSVEFCTFLSVFFI